MKKIIFLILLTTETIAATSQNTCDLIVKVENIKQIKGSLKIAVYDHSDHFLSKEVMSDSKAINASTLEFSFRGLGTGMYAISIYHDENDNGKLDANFMGIPSEPYAFSNNAKGLFGPPSFEDCQFEITNTREEILISL